MDREEIRYLLGSTIYARAKAYENRVQNLECETAENGVRHLSADVRGSGRNLYRTQAWLRQNEMCIRDRFWSMSSRLTRSQLCMCWAK